jgi:hypothetical protein
MRHLLVASALILAIQAGNPAEAARRRPVSRPEIKGESALLITARVTGNNVRLSLLFPSDGAVRHVLELPWDSAVWPTSVTPHPGRVLGIRGGEIVLVDLQSGSATTLLNSNTPGSAAWSPDGGSIVYSDIVPGAKTWDLFIVEVDAGTGTIIQPPHNLTASPAASELYPSWSPDGSALTATVSSDQRADLHLLQLAAEIQLLQLASDRRSMTSTRTLTSNIPNATFCCGSAVWSTSSVTAPTILFSARDYSAEPLSTVRFVEPAGDRRGVLVSHPSRNLVNATLSPDGGTLAVNAAVTGAHEVLFIENLNAILTEGASPSLRPAGFGSGGEVMWVDGLMWVTTTR